MNKGYIYAVTTYIIWGMFPVYWKALSEFPALQLVSHRILWSFIFLAVAVLFMQGWNKLIDSMKKPFLLAVCFLASFLISLNWLTYVWAVNRGFIIQASLGYFINPLISVFLGVIFFGERLRRMQWASLILAASGVVYLAFIYGKFPWIALTLAFSFGFYGLVKKIARLDSLTGLTVETGLLFLPAFFFLVYCEIKGSGAFLHHGRTSDFLMAGAGVITAVPLLMFASAAKRIPLSMIGLFQYITPTLQFLTGLFIYKEPFSGSQLAGFIIVWAGLFVFGIESLVFSKKHVL